MEEAYEAYDADDDSLIYELVDMCEVCDSIINFNSDHVWLIPRCNNKKVYNESKYSSFSFKHYLDNKEYQIFEKIGYLFAVALSRKKQFYEVEIRVWSKKNKSKVENHLENTDKTLLTFLVDTSSEMLRLSSVSEIKCQAQFIKKQIMDKILPQLRISSLDFCAAKNAKLVKNGAFEKKYVLLTTKFSGDIYSSSNDNNNLPILHKLTPKEERTVELLKNDNIYTLLLRKKIPMEYIEYFERFSSEKINTFFDSNCKIDLKYRHEQDIIYIDISQKIDYKYEQIELKI